MRRNCWNNPNTNLEGVGKGTRASPFLYHTPYFRVSWAAVRPSMQAHPSRHSGLDPESWAACVWYCAAPVSSLSETLHATSLPSASLYHRAAVPSRSLHSRLFFPPLSFRPPSRNPGWLVRGVALRRCHRYRRRCTQRPYHPRRCTIAPLCTAIAPLPCHSLARQLGCGSATCASTVALTLHQLFALDAASSLRGFMRSFPRLRRGCYGLRLPHGCRLGGRHDGGIGNACFILANASQGSLARQLGCGSAIHASTVALTLHQLSASSAG